MFYDIRERLNKLRAVNIIIGGRGIGKTYSALRFMIEEKKPFIYLRNTDIQMQESATFFGNPFKRLNKDFDWNVSIEAEKRHYMIYDDSGEDRQLIGYGAALSTFANLRGVDLSDVVYVVFDEFIERRKLAFKQFDAFHSFYETVNRNRELLGEKPLCCILLSNSQTLQNDILSGYGLIDTIVKMTERGERMHVTKDLFLELPTVDISAMKADTAAYRLAAGTKIAREAIENEFAYDSFKNVKKLPIKEYVPVCTYDNIVFYRHKSKNQIYACQIPTFGGDRYEKENRLAFLKEVGLYLREYAIRGKMFYSSYEVKIAVDTVFAL